jgi:hypothetical protein
MFAPVRPKSSEKLDAPEQATTMVRACTYMILVGVLVGLLWSLRDGYAETLFPATSSILKPGNFFGDLTDFYPLLKANDPYSGLSVYPPFAFFVMEPFSWIGGTAAIVLWTLVAAVGLGTFVAWELDFVPPLDRAAAVVVLTVCTYPFLFAFGRGNVEVFVTLLLAAAVWAMQSGRGELAAVAIGAAAAMKGYPLIFGALFLAWRQWRLLAITAITTVFLSGVALISYYGLHVGHALRLFHAGVREYNDTFVVDNLGLGWGCSLFGPVKVVVRGMFGGTTDTVREVLPVYTLVAALLGICVVLVICRLPLRFWEQIALLVLALNLLPTVSADYKLLHLVVPMVLFLRYGVVDRWRWWYLAGFVALMVPKPYVPGNPGGGVTGIGVILDPLIMTAMAIMIILAGHARHRAVERSATGARVSRAGRSLAS